MDKYPYTKFTQGNYFQYLIALLSQYIAILKTAKRLNVNYSMIDSITKT